MAYRTMEEAKSAADSKNAEPLKDGQERRTPHKVYKVSANGKEAFAPAQTPGAAIAASVELLGITVDRVDHDNLPPVNEYLSKLTDAQKEEVRRLLGGK